MTSLDASVRGCIMFHSSVQANAALVTIDATSFSLLDADTPEGEVGRHLPQLRALAHGAFPHYPYNGFFTDDAFQTSLRDGRHLSLVAKRGGNVIGHNAIVRDRWAGVRHPNNPHHAFEMGRAMVSPSERGRGVGGELAKRRHDIVTERYHPALLYSDCATGHTVSTRALLNVGYLPLGLLLGIWDDTFAIGQRESALVMAHLELRLLLRGRSVFMPSEAIPLARAVYDLHKIPRVICRAEADDFTLPVRTDFVVQNNPMAHSAEVFVREVGADIESVVENLMTGGAMPEAGTAQSIVIHLKTHSPTVDYAYSRLKRQGFIPALIGPEFGVDDNGYAYDVLTLQYLSPAARHDFLAERIQAPEGAPEIIKNLILSRVR